MSTNTIEPTQTLNGNYAILPEQFYVVREADAQLARIIEEMRVPGAVLVARQMGKTNLLLRAKRTMESENRIFAYVDMSSLSQNERDCYRAIIDTIIEPNALTFADVKAKISHIRAGKNTPAGEYSKCLKVLLKHFNGKLVITIDEVDTLKGKPFASNFFSKIRSHYFERSTRPELCRMTYILAGMGNPVDLISDPNKSPFNIAKSIYLSDFTEEEHLTFIRKSGIDFHKNIQDRIYEWANGNPRITYDICSAASEIITKQGSIGVEDIDRIVAEKYLSLSDTAPIDHIKRLVESDADLVTALQNIHRGKSERLGDDVRNKLFSYGIVKSPLDQKVVIKNRIISECLSEDWLASIILGRNKVTFNKVLVNKFEGGSDRLLRLEKDEMPVKNISPRIVRFSLVLNGILLAAIFASSIMYYSLLSQRVLVKENNERQTIAKMDQIELFVEEVKKAVSRWTIYHKVPDRLSRFEQVELDVALKRSQQLYSRALLEGVDVNWQVFALYHFCYLRLMEVDFAYAGEKQKLIDEAIDDVIKLEVLFSNKLSLNYSWLDSNNIRGNFDRLAAMIFAVDANINPDDPAKLNKAIKYLKRMSKIEITNGNLVNDRILGRIIEFALKNGDLEL